MGNSGGDKPSDHDDDITNGYPASVQRGNIYSSVSKFNRDNGFAGKFDSTTSQGHAAAIAAGYVPYYPMKSRMSPFYKQEWFWWTYSKSEPDAVISGTGPKLNPVIFYNHQSPTSRFVITSDKHPDNTKAVASNQIPTSGPAFNNDYTIQMFK